MTSPAPATWSWRRSAWRSLPAWNTSKRSRSRTARASVLAGMQAVDFVTSFDEATPLQLIRAIRPDVLIKGADYRKDEVVGAELVESYGGRVHLATLHHGYSTSRLIEQMRAA